MGKYFLVIFSLLVTFITQAQTGYKVDVTVKKFANQYMYLGYYYGTNQKPIRDSIKLDKLGKGTFKGKQKLVSGIYLLGYPSKSQYAEMVVGKNQIFAVTFDADNVLNTMRYTNNDEGTQFQAYQKYMQAKGEEMNKLSKDETVAQDVKQKASKKINDDVLAYRKGIMTKTPKSVLANVLNIMEEPTIPEAKMHPGGVYDSSYAWKVYKNNYWNKVDLGNATVLYNPVFESRFDNFFENIVFPSPDSIKVDVDKMMEATKNDKEVFKITASKLVERYVNPKIMGLDAVFVHIFEKYINTKKIDWFDEKQMKFLSDRYYFLVYNMVGEPARELNLTDTFGKEVTLYGIQAPYTILVFWDATCGHCKEVVPKVDSIYINKWKDKGVKLMGIMTDGGLDNYKNYIIEHKFTSWIHAYESDAQKKRQQEQGLPNFRQMYDVVSTPKIYLLDAEKRIKAKQITWDQLDKILEDLTNKK